MRIQQVLMPSGDPVSWTVVDADWSVVEPAEAFLAHLHAVERSPNTVKAYAHDLRDWFTFLDGTGVVWSAVRLEHVGRFVAWLRLPPAARDGRVVALPSADVYCAAATVNRKLAAVSSFYEFHQRRGVELGELLTTWKTPTGRGGSWRPLLAHLGPPPQRRRTVKLRAGRRIPGVLDSGQVEAVLAACGRLRDRLLFTILADTGLRIGEALGLRHEDIDPAGRVVAVTPRRNSNGARVKGWPRQVPLPARVVRLYSDYLHTEYGDLDCDYVFVNLWSAPVGHPLCYRSVYDLVGRLRTRTGITFGPHTFRHTYATELLRRKVPVEIAQRLLGHASISTTSDTYAHLKVEDARRALVDAGWLSEQAPGR